jgi:hypothetical protein
MKKLLGHPKSLKKVSTKYCGGCGGVIPTEEEVFAEAKKILGK